MEKIQKNLIRKKYIKTHKIWKIKKKIVLREFIRVN